ncbi:MAG: FtsH protease activity modulator HflK [Acidobacteriota bacterium]|nr:FtsH protease activity modulator HflK [Acidobacteriota bacterium]
MDTKSRWPHEAPEIQIPRLSQLPRKTILAIVVAVAIVVLASLSFYQVGPDEEAVVLRLGKYRGFTMEPGLRVAIPFVDRVYKVPTRRQLKQEFGFRTLQAGRVTRYSGKDYPEESLMLTGDLNVADVEWIVQYRSGDPYRFLFRVRSVEETFRDLSEAVMREVIGDHSVDEVLTIGRAQIAEDAKRRLQELCDKFDTGIQVEQLVLQDVNPPEQVRASFNEVNQAEQEREKLINMAEAERNKAVPRAQGEAAEQISRAEGYAIERVNNAKGEAARFLALYEEYRRAPRVTRRRIYLETIAAVLPAMGDKIVVDEKLKNMLPLLNLSGGSASPPVSAAPKGGGR